MNTDWDTPLHEWAEKRFYRPGLFGSLRTRWLLFLDRSMWKVSLGILGVSLHGQDEAGRRDLIGHYLGQADGITRKNIGAAVERARFVLGSPTPAEESVLLAMEEIAVRGFAS